LIFRTIPQVVGLEYYKKAQSLFLQLSEACSDPKTGRNLLLPHVSKAALQLLHTNSFTNALLLQASPDNIAEILSEENERALGDLFRITVFGGTRLERVITYVVPFSRRICHPRTASTVCAVLISRSRTFLVFFPHSNFLHCL
jgi:hypothetical protein